MLELNFNPFPVLATERLDLRRITFANDQDLFRLRRDIDAMRYLGKTIPTSIEAIHELIQRIEDGIVNNTAVSWGLFLKNQDNLIGNISYHKILKEHYRAEIGYMLLPAFWKQGIMSEAAKAVIEYGFKEMKLHSIEAHINPVNLASGALLKKHCFKKEAYFSENYFFEGKFSDTEVYSLLNK